MKIVSPKEMVQLEKLAYASGMHEEELMLSAGEGVAKALSLEFDGIPRKVLLLCGKGNNGGDGYVAGIHLLKQGWEVQALHVGNVEDASPLCRKYHHQFLAEGGSLIAQLSQGSDLIIDALFGTGFHGKAKETFARVIADANRLKAPIFSIDIPSGLDAESGVVQGEAICAAATLFLQLPKQGFFLGKGWNHVGKLIPIDLGISQDILSKSSSFMEMKTADSISLPPIVRDRHKYQAGYVVGWAGSVDMPGAAILASLAVLRSGAGIMKLLHPPGMEMALASAPYEIIRMAEGEIEQDLSLLNKATAVFLGPGLGRHVETGDRLREILPKITTRCVIDADALYFLSEKMCALPPESVLTPHHEEMARLLNIKTPEFVDLSFLQQTKQFCSEHSCHLVLKGGPTFIFSNTGKIFVSTTGDPGMATAGAGDVLTGVMAGLASQKIAFEEAIKIAVYLHGLAGEVAARKMSSFSMIATDIIDALPMVFVRLFDNKF